MPFFPASISFRPKPGGCFTPYLRDDFKTLAARVLCPACWGKAIFTGCGSAKFATHPRNSTAAFGFRSKLRGKEREREKKNQDTERTEVEWEVLDLRH